MKQTDYRYRLFQAVAHAFGHYMGARFSGWDGDVQLQRYRKLEKALMDYDAGKEGIREAAVS